MKGTGPLDAAKQHDENLVRRGIDELNFAEFPMALLSTTAPSDGEGLVFEDEVTDEGTGRKVRRRLLIEAPAQVGLPLPRDADVLLVLTRHALRPREEVLRRVPFRRGELLRVLGWDDSGQSYRRLDESLRRWTTVTLHYTNAWWDKTHKRWRTRTFHVLDEIELAGGASEQGGEFDGQCWFTWGETVYQSLRARNVRSINLDQYFRLQRAASRQAYRFLGKRFWHTRRLQLSFRTFCCEHVGLSRHYDIGQLKRAVRPVLRELVGIGALRPLADRERFIKLRKGEWEILLLAGEEAKESAPQVAAPLVDALVARGVDSAVAQRLTTRYSEARIREKLAHVDRLTAQPGKSGLRSPAGFLVRAIEKDYEVGPPSHRPAASVVTRRPEKLRTSCQRATVSPAPAVDDLALAARHLATLTPSERLALEQAAVDACDSFHRESLRRLERQGGQLLEELRLKLVANYLRRHGLLDQGANPKRRA